MKIKRTIFVVLIVMDLVACSPEPGFFFADSVKLVKTVKIEGNDYFIYLRISGSHDKVALYELYASKPTFDKHKQSNILAISEEPIDSIDGPVDPFSGVVSKVVSKLLIENLKLRIVYTKGNVQEIDLKDIPLEVKSLTNSSTRN